MGSGVFLLAAGLSFQQRWPASVLMASMCLFMGFFSLGMGAITFVVASELFPLPVRGKAMALTVFVNRLLRCVSILRAGWLGRASPSQAKASHPPIHPPKNSGVVALSFLSMVQALTYANTFYLFALFCFASTVFYGVLLPETKVRRPVS